MYVAHLVILGWSRRRHHCRPFSNVDNFRPEEASDVIFGVVLELAGVDVSVIFGDSKSNRYQDMRLPHFVTDIRRTTTTTTPAYGGHHIRPKRVQEDHQLAGPSETWPLSFDLMSRSRPQAPFRHCCISDVKGHTKTQPWLLNFAHVPNLGQYLTLNFMSSTNASTTCRPTYHHDMAYLFSNGN